MIDRETGAADGIGRVCGSISILKERGAEGRGGAAEGKELPVSRSFWRVMAF